MSAKIVGFVAAMTMSAIISAVIVWQLKPSPEPPRAPLPSTPDTVYVETIKKEVLESVRHEPGIIERITEVEVIPDTIYVQRDSSIDGPSVGGEPDVEWGILEVVKHERLLRVTSIGPGRIEARSFTLPERDSNYTLRSGVTPANLRTGRKTGFRFGATVESDIWRGLRGDYGADIRLVGPVSFGTPDSRISPVGSASSDGDVRVGVTLRRDFFGGI